MGIQFAETWRPSSKIPRRVKFSFLVCEQADEHPVDPAAGDNRVKPADDNVEARVKVLVVVLDFGIVTESGQMFGQA